MRTAEIARKPKVGVVENTRYDEVILVVQQRCEEIAQYMLEHNSTIREAAAHFGMGKSTLHVEVTERLRTVNVPLYSELKEHLEANWDDRCRRGGVACDKKYPHRLKEWRAARRGK